MLKVSDSCTRCGLCVRVCPTYVIAREAGEKPRMLSENCIRCGHCEAVCPADALRNTMVPEDDKPLLPAQPVIDSETASLFLRSRRSVRCYHNREVPRELTEQLLDIGRCAQTGGNRQGVSFMVLAPAVTKRLHALLVQYFSGLDDEMGRQVYQHYMAGAKEGRDLLFRGAPMVILALTARGQHFLRRNGTYALTYVEQYAPALGLGTCWAGYLERYLYTDAPEMRALLELPEDLEVAAALLYGQPQITYRRAAGRDPLKVFWR